MTEPFCSGRYLAPGAATYTICPNRNTEECPLKKRMFGKLSKDPCYRAIFLPSRFLTERKGNRLKAVEDYIRECLLE